MNIIDYSVQWARAEVFSAKMVAIVGVVVLLAAVSFYIFGKTPIARAYTLPLALSAAFLIVAAGGLYYANKPRTKQFPVQYEQNAEQFVQDEIARTAKSDHDLHLMVYRVLPAVIILCAIGIIFLTGAHWRAWLISLIMLSSILMGIDSNTHRRNADYREKLIEYQQQQP